MRSRLYECRVMHARTAPKRHRFVHRVFMLALDLDELDAVHRATRLLSINAGNLYSFRERDYLPVHETLHNPSGAPVAPVPAADHASETQSLKSRVVAWLTAHGVALDGGRVELVTMPRVAGYLFNPVSFYFCYDASGAPVAAIAEVTNTFREVKPYLLDRSTWRDGAFRLRVPKHFYVSPYSDVDVAFDFVLRPAGDRLAIQIDDYTDGVRTLVSTLTGSPRPLTTRALAWFTVKHPLLTIGVMTLIHLHALVLYLKRVPWFSKASRAADQRDLHRPHPSLTQPRLSRTIP
jgi:uncharacterized protein